MKIINQKEEFDQLVRRGYDMIRLNSQLTPMDAGWNEPNFVYETVYKENQNYGIKGGSIHKSKDDKTGKLLLVDFDVKEKIKLENGQIIIKVIEQAKTTLKSVREATQNRNYYFANTKTNGLHMGILINEDIQQHVSLYHHQDCEKLRIDTRTKVGYVVAIAPNYKITKIPELFDTVISDFENFMLGLGFVNSDDNKTSSQSGSLSTNFKRKARKVLNTMDVSYFPELGTDETATHDFVSFCVMSCKSRNIPLEVTTEKIMGVLSQITTTKDNTKTEKEIETLYNKNYPDFKTKDTDVEINKDEKEEKRLERIKKFGTPLKQIENYLNTTIRKDPIIVKQLIRTYLSAYTNNPINIALLAPSSDGKTYATVEVSKIFPKGDVILVGRLSPTALIHQNGFLIDEEGNNIDGILEEIETRIITAKKESKKEDEEEAKQEKNNLIKSARKCVDLKNKILLFLDNPNPATYEMLKPIMSHDSKEITYITTKGDGSLNVKKSIIRNHPVFIFCSAKNEEKNEVWEEIKTRVFMSSPNSDIEKYEEANKLTAQKLSTPSWAKKIWQNEEDEKWSRFFVEEIKERLNKLCKDDNNPIINPFNEIITEKFPHTQGVSMRHFTRLMSFINLETLLNSEYNPELYFKTKDDQIIKSIFTTLNDIDDACQVLKNISTIPPEKIKFMNKIFYPLIIEVIDSDKGLTSTQLADKYTEVFKKQITIKQVTENYLKPLVDSGVLSAIENPTNLSQNLYQPASTIAIHDLEKLPLAIDTNRHIDTSKRSTLIDTSTPTSPYIDSCLEDLEKVSTEFRKSNMFFRINNRDIDLIKLKEILFSNSRNQSTLQEVSS